MIKMNLGADSYNIEIKRGALAHIDGYFDLNRRVMIVTDDGVPAQYAKTVLSVCKDGRIYTIPQGEGSKSMELAEKILQKMLGDGFSRQDCVVAVGGGVVGDLAGFVASLYMRGIDFYNIPTTLLSQVDSSIGGKTAVNFCGIKNIIGAFYQPKGVVIDPNVLSTLSPRQLSSGIAESIKAGVIMDKELFALLEQPRCMERIDEIIERSLEVKRYVVEQDVHEKGLRKILNFGHTIGHAIESAAHGELLHGECVALGMLYMSKAELGERLFGIYKATGLYGSIENYLNGSSIPDTEEMIKAAAHDKKTACSGCTVITADAPGIINTLHWTAEELAIRIREGL